MATYVMTPEERRARAKKVLEERRAIAHQKQAYRLRTAYQEQERTRIAAEKAEREKIQNANPLLRYYYTIGDIVGNVITGATKGLEGIVDLGIGVVGAVGGIFSDDFQNTMKEAISYDFAGEIVGNPLQEAMKYSYMKEGGIGEQIASGVGQMLPAVVATIATYGAYGGFAAGSAAAQSAAQTASLITMGTSAAGTSTEEAFNDGAEYYRGLGYGIASGLVEAGTENLTGGFDKALVGKGILDDITSSVAKTGLKRVAKNAVEEGVEEVASELARPGLKTIYKGVDALSEYGDKEYWKGVGEAGLAGAGTGLAYGGTVGYGLSKAGIGYVGKEADIADSLTEISSLREKADNLQAEDDLGEINKRKIAETTKKNYQNIEKVLKSVNDSKRQKLIEKFSLHKAFNPDGSMNEQFNTLFNDKSQGNGEGENTPLASLKKSSYSVSLWGNESTIESDLNKLSENRATAYLKKRQAHGENITIEEARNTVGRFSVLSTELSEKAQSSRRKFNKALNALNKLSGLNTTFVITEANDSFNGSLVDNERMYISADAFENDTWAETLVHEYTHLEEGTAEYNKLVNFLYSDSSLWQKAKSDVLAKEYGFKENQMREISEKANKGIELTEGERKLYKSFVTEVAAHGTEYLLGNEGFIEKLVTTERSLARKIIDKIFNLKKAFSKVESKSVKAQQKLLEKAEQLYLAAARKAGDAQLIKYILSHSPEKEEKSISNENIRYAIKYPSFTKEDIYKNINKLADMKPVANINANKLEKTGKSPKQIFEEYFASLGNSIYSDVYGDISLGKSSVKSEIRHGITATKIASIEAIPSVIENGEVIFFESKQGGDERVKRIVVAAPITIADIPYYMGVMLQRDPSTQYLYLHNVAIEKEMNENSRAHLVTTGADENNEHLSMTIILQNAINVKLEKQKTDKNFISSTDKNIKNGNNGGLTEAVTRINEEKEQVTEKEDTPEENNSDVSGDIRFSLIGRTEDGRGIYHSNYPKNTPKTVKQNDIINLVQNVWSKNPIKLNLVVNGKTVPIEAKFNPELSERSDLSKIVFGNRKGTNSEKRITLDLASDLYQIAEESHHVRSKNEIGKDNPAHIRVSDWHYFLTNLVFVEDDGTKVECYMNIDVKQNDSGHWFYSFAIEKGTAPRTLLAGVTEGSATVPINSISENEEKVNRNSEKVLGDEENIRFSLRYDDAIEQLEKDVLDTSQNTHLKILDHTPQIYIDKAGASNREIIMAWDIAYLAMKKNGDIPGHYHGLGADIMKALPDALKDPLYIVKQKNGRIAAVTRIVVKGKRAVFASIELESFKTTIQEGETESKKYNLVVTVTDAKPNYLQNTIFSGDVVYNKNKEDPAHFILRLKSLEKALPTYDHAESSNNIIPENSEKVNSNSEKVSGDEENIRFSLIGRTEGGRGLKVVIDTDRDIFKGVDRKDYGRAVRNFMHNHFRGKLINNTLFTKRSEQEYTHSGYTQSIYGQKDGVYEAKMKASTELDKMVSAGVFLGHEDTKHPHVYNKNGYDRYGIVFNLDGEDFNGEILIAIGEGDRRIFYDIVNIKRDDRTFTEELSAPITTVSNNIIPENSEKVNSNSEKVSDDDENINFSLKEPKRYYGYRLADGKVEKYSPYSYVRKIYSKKETEGIINDVLSNYLSFGDAYGVLSGKSTNEVINMLWRGFNTAVPGRQAGVALDAAEYIIRNAAVKSILEDPNLETYKDTVALLKPYLHSINLDGIKGDIKHRYDKDNSPYLLWGKRKGTNGVGADVIAMELNDLGFQINAVNEADIFFEIHEAYKNAVNELKKSTKTMLDFTLNAKERHQLKQDIALRIHRAFDENGERKRVERFVDEKGRPTELSKLISEYEKKATEWRDRYYEEQEKHKLVNVIFDKIKKLSDLKKGTFYNASQYKDNIFKNSIDQLIKIKHRSDINKSGTRKILGKLSEWYVKENPMLSYDEDSVAGDNNNFKSGVFDEDIAMMLQNLSNGKGELNVNELTQLDMLIGHFTRFVETYNKVWRDGKYVEAEPIAKGYVEKIQANKTVKVGWLRKWFEKYENAFADPMTLARYMDRYEKGFYSDEMQELRKAAVSRSVMENNLREPLEAFYKKHKRFLKDMKNKTVDYQGTQVPLAQAMLLYMSLKRDQSLLSLAESGFAFKTDKDAEPMRPGGFASGEGITIDEAHRRVKNIELALASQFTDAENEYISIVEKIFNEDCKELKRKTDLEYQGYANVLEGYYVPIRRYIIGKSVDAESYFDELARVSKASFNNSVVKGAKQELYIEPLNEVVDRHIRALSTYASFAMPIRNFNVLYNLAINGKANKPISVKTESVGLWSDGNAYFKKLVKDIQHITSPSEVGDKFTAKLRGSLVKFYLGLNPKVWLTQCSSFAAAANVLDVDCITKGLGMKSPDVDKYCKLAMVRNTENTVALAQGVIDNVGKFGDVLMKPIGKIDRLVVKKLFGACRLQIEKNEGIKFDTEENKIKAGELLEKVILETQQNAFATDRSAAMRSKNELSKTLTMFSADQMKLIGRVIDAIGELSVLKAKRRNTTDNAEISALEADIKSANGKTVRAVGSLVAASIFTALIAQLFRWWYGKDDEEENAAKDIAVDTVGNLFGGLPIIKEIFSFFSDGYGIDNFAYSVLNDTLDTSKKLFSMSEGIIDGTVDSREIASTVKSLIYTSGQLCGVPTRNAYNNIYGIIEKFSPSAAYSINNMFYKQSYRSDLAKAIEREDEDMIATIVGLMLNENVGGIKDSAARKALDSLVQAGYDVIPKSVGRKITYDGTEYELTPRQVKQFEKVYFVANEALASLVKLSQYKSASDEVRAKAVNFIYTVYYNLAIQDLLGIDLETKSILFAEALDIEKLALVVATANSITADLDKDGKAITGTRKTKLQTYINSLQLMAAEKYMLMGYLGYTNTHGKEQVRAYINRLSLTKTEKAKLLEYSGYAA